MVQSERALVSSYRPSIRIIPLSALICPKFYIALLSSVANPQSSGMGGRRGLGMVPFERALVSSYRLSIVTFPLSLRVSDILPLLCPITPLFPHPTCSFPKISPYFPGCRWTGGWLLGSEERRYVGPLVRAISFQDVQPM